VVLTFSVLGNPLPEPGRVAGQVRDMLLDTGHQMSILVSASGNPFDMLAEAYAAGEDLGRRAEQLVHDAELDLGHVRDPAGRRPRHRRRTPP
jgi:hypothetical protein